MLSMTAKPRIIGTDLKRSASNPKPTDSATTCSYCETSQCCPWKPKPKRIGTHLKRSASNMKPTFSATTIFLWQDVSMLSTTQKKNHLYWFEKNLPRIWKQCFLHQLFSYGETSQCCSCQPKPWIICTGGLLRVWNHRFLQNVSYRCETCQCCPWQPEPRNIGADLKRSASSMKPTISVTTAFILWNVSVLSMTARTWDHLYRFEKVSFECETTVSATTIFLLWHVSVLRMTAKTYEHRYRFEEVCF